MKKICFVCLGNICRSPMAEFIMKDKVKKLELDDIFFITSRATSYEEVGNSMHYGTKSVLNKNNISFTNHRAKRLEETDYDLYDYFICMDESNVKNVLSIFNVDPKNKISKLLSKDIEDPWYTGNFVKVFNDINSGIDLLLSRLLN